MIRWRLGVALVVALCGLLCAGEALADSSSIAGAPVITPGQQNYGNLTSVTPNGSEADAYWLLPVVSGDRVTVNWQAQNSETYLNVYPSGTNDYNVGQTSSIQRAGLNSNHEESLAFQVNSDGTLPLQFAAYVGSGEGDAGPYNFNVGIVHAMDVTLGAIPSALSGTASATVVSPDGAPLGSPIVATLQISSKGVPWTTLGEAAVAGGAASIPYTVPATLAGDRVSFRAVGSGAGYASMNSMVQTLRLPDVAAPVHTPAPSKPATATTKLRTKFDSVKGRGRPAIRAMVTVHWKYTEKTTFLTSISARKFPRRARLTLECLGKGCPTETRKIRGSKVKVPVRITVSRARLRSLVRYLRKSPFHAGDKVRFTVSEPRHKSAVAVARIRDGKAPRQLR